LLYSAIYIWKHQQEEHQEVFMAQTEAGSGKRSRPKRSKQVSSLSQGFFDAAPPEDTEQTPKKSNQTSTIASNQLQMATIGEESFSNNSFSNTSYSESLHDARNSKRISSIGEDFYNSISGSYISDDDEEEEEEDAANANDSSSDDEVPYLSPQASNHSYSPTKNNQDALLMSERSSESMGTGKRDVSLAEDTLIMSERTNGSSKGYRDNSYGDETLMMSHGQDTLMISDRSDLLARSENSGVVRIKRDASQGDDTLLSSERSDTLLVSERSAGSNKLQGDVLARSDRSGGNMRDMSSGYDSLLVSETTDESWRRMAKFVEDDDGDDDSSISSTPSTPFPNLENFDDETKSESQKVLGAIENPPLSENADASQKIDIALEALEVALASPSTNSVEKGEDGDSSSDEDRPLSGALIADIFGVDTNIEEGTLPPNANSDYDGSISTNNSLRNNEERARRVPRRWIIDRIDGTVIPGEEEEGLPRWRRKPPLFLCLPSPLLGIFPWLFEENSCCKAVGKCGFFGGDTTKADNKTPVQRGDLVLSTNNNNNTYGNTETATNTEKSTSFLRTLVIVHALLLNACGLFATILAGLALTRIYPSLLQAAPFGKTTVIPTLSIETADTDSVITADAVTLYLGLLALGIDIPANGDMVVVGFRDFCDTPGMEQFLNPEECETCSEVSLWIVVGYFLAMIGYLPTFSIGISRLYKNYDANCSKVSAGIWSLVSIIGYIIVLSCYGTCLGSLYDGKVLYTSEGAIQQDNAIDNPWEQVGVAEFKWKAGVGQILFLIGLTLKIFDFASNCCIATPAITRSRELQWEYERGSRPVSPPSEDGISESGNPQEGSSDGKGMGREEASA